MPRPANYDQSARDAKILALADRGHTHSEIAERFSLDRAQVSHIIRSSRAQKASA